MRQLIRKVWRHASQWATRIFSPAKMAAWMPYGNGYLRPRTDFDLAYEFGVNARLRTPVESIAEDVADAARTLRLVRVTVDRNGTERRTPVRDHALLRLLKHPHPALSWGAFVKLIMINFDLTGKAPIRMQGFDAVGRPTQLTPLPPHTISKLPEGEDNRFHVTWNAATYAIPAAEMLYWYEPDPLNPFGDGCGRARAVDDEIAQDSAMSKFNGLMFSQGAFMGAIVNVPGASNLEDLEEKFQQRRSGLRNAHKSFLTNSDQPVTVTNLTPKLTELNFQEGREQVRDFILQAYQVTRERAGITKDTSRGNLEGSDFHQQSKNVKPRLGRLADFLNTFLLPLFDIDGRGNLEIEFADPVKESEESRRLTAETGVRTGVLTIDEAREKLGKPPLPNGAGNVLMIPVNNVVLVPASGDLVAAAASAAQALNGHTAA